MKASDVKIGQRVRFTRNEEVRGHYDNYFGSMSYTTSVEHVGKVKEIVSKTCVIVEDGGGDEYSVEPRKMKLVQYDNRRY
jgi:hypothetical protein